MLKGMSLAKHAWYLNNKYQRGTRLQTTCTQQNSQKFGIDPKSQKWRMLSVREIVVILQEFVKTRAVPKENGVSAEGVHKQQLLNKVHQHSRNFSGF